jgi:hypothetical protein
LRPGISDSALAAFEERLQYPENAVPDRRPRVPGTKPAHGPLFPDDIGRLWVRVGEGPSGAWDVFAPDGVYLGQIPVPQAAGYQQAVVRGSRLALATVIDGVPTVIVYSLVGM